MYSVPWVAIVQVPERKCIPLADWWNVKLGVWMRKGDSLWQVIAAAETQRKCVPKVGGSRRWYSREGSHIVSLALVIA